MAPAGKPTLIHLANSSSQAVLWLLEELGVDYDIRKFQRGDGPAPPELKETHPQGKSPQLLTADGRVITQLSAITMYLLLTYDTARRFRPPADDTDAAVREEQLVCIGVSDMASKIGAKFMFHGLALKSPFFVRPLLNRVRATIDSLVLGPDVEAIMSVLEAEIGGKDWFMGGEAPSRADFVLHFFVDLAVQPKYVDLGRFPRLAEWMARCEAREAWKRSLEKGNGYDLDFPSRW